MNPTHYLRVEGVNLGHFIEDTADLSTIRGGGLLLLDAGEQAQAFLDASSQVKQAWALSVGASSGLFALELEADVDAEQVREALIQNLQTPAAALAHATLVVDIAPVSGDFEKDRERLLALNRHRQMTTRTLVPPPWNNNMQVEPCDFDRLRPGTESRERPPRLLGEQSKTVPASPSAVQRRQFGIVQKKQFYQKIVGEDYQPPKDAPISRFAQELGELAGPPYPKGVPETLQGKIAVLYWDGNKFGSLQREHCDSPARQQQFDVQVRRLRAKLLAAVLRDIDRQPGSQAWWSGSRNRRLETLLWGGDELIWVVPAWQGWRVASLFYAETSGWEVDLSDEETTERHRLTHAGGLVYANHKAPIHRLTELARRLAEGVKDRLQDQKCPPGSSEANRFDYEILESFDHVGPDLAAYRKRRLPDLGNGRLVDVSLPGATMADLADALKALHHRSNGEGEWGPFPTRQLHIQFRRWRREVPPSDLDSLSAAITRDPNLKPHKDRLIQAAKATGPAAFWYHLAHLWDYVAGVKNL